MVTKKRKKKTIKFKKRKLWKGKSRGNKEIEREKTGC